MREGLDSNRRGVAGFFLDGPILVLIIVTVTVLLAIFSQAYLQYERESERAELDSYCLDLKREIQRHPEMVAENENYRQRGEFSIEKLNRLTNQTLIEELDIDRNYDFKIHVNDTRSDQVWIFGSADNEEEPPSKSSYSSPILLSGENTEPKIGELRVIVWEG
ncbi:MAG: hypothetical protein V5A88_03165 [Candidatus Thermoplasmatota archaeon]